MLSNRVGQKNCYSQILLLVIDFKRSITNVFLGTNVNKSFAVQRRFEPKGPLGKYLSISATAA